MSVLQKIRSSYVQGTSPLNTTSLSQVSPRMQPLVPPAAADANQALKDQLTVLDAVLSQIEAKVVAAQPVVSPVLSAAVPLAIDQATNTLNPVAPAVGTAKEAVNRGAQGEQLKVDAGSGIQVVEYEPSPEISPEVAEFLQKVEQNQNQQPQEIVIAGDVAQLLPQTPVLKPVIVLPITPEVEAVGAKKGPQWSVRWLVEWSRRLMKMFSGKILYADSETN